MMTSFESEMESPGLLGTVSGLAGKLVCGPGPFPPLPRYQDFWRMTMVRRVVNLRAAVAGGVLVLAPAPPAARAAQESGQARDAERAGDLAAIRRRIEEFLRVVSRGDAREVAGFWTDRGEYLRGDD